MHNFIFHPNRKFFLHKHVGLGMHFHHHQEIKRGGDLITAMSNLKVKAPRQMKIRPLKFKF